MLTKFMVTLSAMTLNPVVMMSGMESLLLVKFLKLHVHSLVHWKIFELFCMKEVVKQELEIPMNLT